MGELRSAVGDDVELMVDFHGRCASVGSALHYIDALAEGRPLLCVSGKYVPQHYVEGKHSPEELYLRAWTPRCHFAR